MKKKKQKAKIKLHWVDYYNKSSQNIGNAYGYKIHNDTLKKYFSFVGKITPHCADALHLISPEHFKRPGGGSHRIWLFSMFEGTSIPDLYKKKMEQADCLIAPSNWVSSVFERHFDLPIFVVPHGVEKHFSFKRRKFPHDRPFRFLWVGAANPRKGYEEIVHVWQNLFLNRPDMQLYIKTTRLKVPFEIRGNVVLDGRNLTRRALVKLYHSAHCFLFPTRGEGFGLTLAEAMRTGLPCIATDYSGHTDFFNEHVGYPIEYRLDKSNVHYVGDKRKDTTIAAYPNVNHLAKHMIDIFKNYDNALKVGEKASHLIRTRFTWQKSAQKLCTALQT